MTRAENLMRQATRSRASKLLNVAASNGFIVTVTPFRNYKNRQIIQHTRITYLVRNGNKTYYKVKARSPKNKLFSAPKAIRPKYIRTKNV
jgi:hypothetical protein